MRTLDHIRSQWPAWLVLAVPALLPFSRLVELPILLMLVFGARAAWRARKTLASHPGLVLYTGLFACYWIPGLLSAPDAANPERAWTWTAAQLRFLPAGAFAILCLDAAQRRLVLLGTAALVLSWAVDALVQAALGFNLLGMARSPERLNGIFGASNIKLGPMLAVLAATALETARRARRGWIFLGAFTLLLLALLLIGTRAAWIMYLVVLLAMLALYGARRPGRALLAAAVLGLMVSGISITAYELSDTLRERVDRSLLALQGESEGADQALSLRLPIWRTAGAMAAEHWVNGIGVRGFRYVYPDYAAADDPLLAEGAVATHAHQLLLEAASETGLLGVGGWLLGTLLLLRGWRRAPHRARQQALPWALCVLAAVFPLNSHLAFYSTFWSLVFWWLLMLLCASLDEPPPPARDVPEAG